MILVKAIGHEGERVVRRWDPAKHPRDRHGRFIEVGHTVQLADGTTGRVIGDAGAGKIQVRRADGHVETTAARATQLITPGQHAPAVEPVTAGDLHVGDHAMLTHPVTGEPEPATVISRTDHDDGTVELDARRGDGSVDTLAMDRDHPVDRITGTPPPDHAPDHTAPAPAPVPAPLPAGTATARPVLYTYQRRKIVALNLDLDAAQPQDVREAAARIRARAPLSAAQARALSQAVAGHAAVPGTRPVQQRSLKRITWRLDAAGAEIHGHAPPAMPEDHTVVSSTTAGELTEGDSAVFRDPDGNLIIAKVRQARSLMGGRIRELDLERDDGTTLRRTVTGRTPVWLLPDRPDDTPVTPPGDLREHVMPGQLRAGDTIRTPGGREGVITHLVHNNAFQSRATIDTDTGPMPVDLWSRDGGPSVIRTARGPASADQPWTGLMQPEHPQAITVDQVRLGDRLHVTDAHGRVTGTVEQLTPVTGSDGTQGVEAGIRADTSEHAELTLFPGDNAPWKITRLAAGDENAAARIEQARAAREEYSRANEVAELLYSMLNDARTRDIRQVRYNLSWTDDIVRQAVTGPPPERVLRQLGTASPLRLALIPHGGSGPEDETVRQTFEQRLTPLLAQMITRQREQLIASLDNATAGLDSPLERRAARERVLDQWTDTPPALDVETISRTLATISAALRAADGTAPAVPPRGPVLPDGADLRDRMAAYRAALPADPAMIGMRQVHRPMFAAPNLTDLEAGRAPAVTMTPVGIPDRAPDGGPGDEAMRHLDVVTAAGRDLDAELQHRLASKGLSPDQIASRKAEIAELSQRRLDSSAMIITAEDKARDDTARQHGFDSFRALVTARRAERDEADDTEYRRLGMIMDAARTDGIAAADKYRQQTDDLTRQVRELNAAHTTAKRDAADLQREAALDIIRQVRSDGIGGVRVRYNNTQGKELTDRAKLVKALRWAEQHYPQSWLSRMRDHAPAGYKVSQVQRGDYTDSYRRIRLSEDVTAKVTGAGTSGRVAVHEMGHAMERAVPGILPLENAYLWSRTSRGPIGSRVRDKRKLLSWSQSEAAYQDSFPEPYSGKDYVSSATGQPTAFELLTTGAESLFAGSDYLDPGFRQWLLGTLAML